MCTYQIWTTEIGCRELGCFGVRGWCWGYYSNIKGEKEDEDDAALNRNLGKYQLPLIWYQGLQDTMALQLK